MLFILDIIISLTQITSKVGLGVPCCGFKAKGVDPQFKTGNTANDISGGLPFLAAVLLRNLPVNTICLSTELSTYVTPSRNQAGCVITTSGVFSFLFLLSSVTAQAT